MRLLVRLVEVRLQVPAGQHLQRDVEHDVRRVGGLVDLDRHPVGRSGLTEILERELDRVAVGAAVPAGADADQRVERRGETSVTDRK
jgi:molybdopterin biosynthesis enzyme